MGSGLERRAGEADRFCSFAGDGEARHCAGPVNFSVRVGVVRIATGSRRPAGPGPSKRAAPIREALSLASPYPRVLFLVAAPARAVGGDLSTMAAPRRPPGEAGRRRKGREVVVPVGGGKAGPVLAATPDSIRVGKRRPLAGGATLLGVGHGDMGRPP